MVVPSFIFPLTARYVHGFMHLLFFMFRDIAKSQESLDPEETYSCADNKLQNRGMLYFSMLLYVIFINLANGFDKQTVRKNVDFNTIEI